MHDYTWQIYMIPLHEIWVLLLRPLSDIWWWEDFIYTHNTPVVIKYTWFRTWNSSVCVEVCLWHGWCQRFYIFYFLYIFIILPLGLNIHDSIIVSITLHYHVSTCIISLHHLEDHFTGGGHFFVYRPILIKFAHDMQQHK